MIQVSSVYLSLIMSNLFVSYKLCRLQIVLGCWLLLSFSPLHASSLSDINTPLTRQTFDRLKKEYGIELSIDKKSNLNWTEMEGVSFLRLLDGLPERLQFLVKNRYPENLHVKKVPVSIREILNYCKVSIKGKNAFIPVFQHKDIQSIDFSETSEYSAKQKEMLSFLLQNNLVASNLEDLIDVGKTKDYQSRQTNYLNYLNRELLTVFFCIHDDIHQFSQSNEWRSIGRWEPHSVLGVKIKNWVKDAENTHFGGYAHPRGMLGPKQDFVEFAATFFAPPISLFHQSIKCRTPVKYAYFKEKFPDVLAYLDHPEFARRGISCPSMDDDFLGGIEFKDVFAGYPVDIGPVNESTVTGFELIYATPGDREISEIAGHLLLRIKLDNNPEAKRQGIENPYDIIIAVLADNYQYIDKDSTRKEAMTKSNREICPPKDETPPGFSEIVRGSIQALKGLSGYLETIYQVDTLQFAIEHYTVKNNRTLERYALNLNKEQKTKLLNHLYRVKRNFKTDYYFFTRNCGSILVKLLGEGLNDNEIATYNSLAAPPNALIRLLLDKGIIKQVHPHFYSYTAQAQIAQDIISNHLITLRKKEPSQRWPDDNDFFNENEMVRAKAYAALYPIAVSSINTRSTILEILNMAQKAELLFTWNKGRCIDYSTLAKGEARKVLKQLLEIHSETNRIYLDQAINLHDSPREALDDQTGSLHTGLMSWHFGARTVLSPALETTQHLFLGGVIYRQQMGDISSLAMQRGTSVELGNIDLFWGKKEKDRLTIEDWHLVGLKIRKIKARRHYIPNVFSRDKKLGLGFTLLEISPDRWETGKYNTLFTEGEMFTNLVSSRLNLDFLNVATGLGLETPWTIKNNMGDRLMSGDSLLKVPFRLNGLLTSGKNRQLQIRSQMEYRFFYSIKSRHSPGYQKKDLDIDISLTYRLPDLAGAEVILNGSLEFLDTFEENINHQAKQQTTIKLGIEVNRW